MKTFKSRHHDKLTRTDNEDCKEGFAARPSGLGDKVLLIVEEDGDHVRILLSKNNVRQLRRQLKAVEKELGWTK